MKKDDRGFTLVELMVVVAILAVLGAVVIYSVSVGKSADALGAANRLDAFVSRTRIGCMGRRAQTFTVLTLDDKGRVVANYYENFSGTGLPQAKDLAQLTPFYSQIIGGSGVSLKYTIKNSTSPLSNNAADNNAVTRITLQFDRDTGALISPLSDQSSSGDCVFTLTGGGRSHTVTIYAATGSHKVD